MSVVILTLSVLLGSFCPCLGSKNRPRDSDEILYLPGAWPQLNFKQYSGYLRGSSDKIHIHYWLVEATSSPESAPLIVWLNGGPGCSSLEGLLTENGPYLLQEGPRLVENPYSWNKVANVLYLEAPAGVGFSYSSDSSQLWDDDRTASDNYHALLHFLEKFPEYEGRRLFVTGESYAGVYVPTLSLLLLNSTRFDFQGLNEYNLYSECAGGVQMSSFNSNHSLMSITELSSILASSKQFIHHDFGNLFRDNIYMKYRRYANSLLRHNRTSRLTMPCEDSTLIYSYLNSPIVRRFINVRLDLPKEWDVCSETVNTNYVRIYRDLTEQYMQLLKSKIFVLIYNGDIDMACNYFGDEWFVDNLNLTTISPRSPWLYVEKDGTKQIGGYWKLLSANVSSLVYTTVRGAGHMVPRDKPAATFHMINWETTHNYIHKLLCGVDSTEEIKHSIENLFEKFLLWKSDHSIIIHQLLLSLFNSNINDHNNDHVDLDNLHLLDDLFIPKNQMNHSISNQYDQQLLIGILLISRQLCSEDYRLTGINYKQWWMETFCTPLLSTQNVLTSRSAVFYFCNLLIELLPWEINLKFLQIQINTRPNWFYSIKKSINHRNKIDPDDSRIKSIEVIQSLNEDEFMMPLDLECTNMIMDNNHCNNYIESCINRWNDYCEIAQGRLAELREHSCATKMIITDKKISDCPGASTTPGWSDVLNWLNEIAAQHTVGDSGGDIPKCRLPSEWNEANLFRSNGQVVTSMDGADPNPRNNDYKNNTDEEEETIEFFNI
ncbi:family S10 non-peptidase homologue (S10 family) [Schistosoma mansoni]|uniref:family S10 non-peptidase homologue (S10 family) n=1 Tax=Schistosoma mansoni TaxID=6183 RepID=UPI00022DC5B3|nr:family S10 non-peptidase homologue (S10 family) [Schistosoma mansoni]|eukprot:XP_018653441.1 family S10 non-peptidase homologue (S10 family) [Schistosoma mansoni]